MEGSQPSLCARVRDVCVFVCVCESWPQGWTESEKKSALKEEGVDVCQQNDISFTEVWVCVSLSVCECNSKAEVSSFMEMWGDSLPCY